MKNILYLFLFLSYTSLAAQDAAADSNFYTWVPSMVTGLNISQVQFENWAKGGDNSLAFTITGDLKLSYRTVYWNFRNNFIGAFGKTKLGDAGIKTTDNEFFLETVLSYHIFGWKVNPYIGNLIRSSITTGYDYNKDPELKIADFFDPGYISQSIGFTYDQLENIQTRLGIGFQETFNQTEEMALRYSDDPETENKIEKFKFETGMESVTDAKFNLDDNIAYTSKLRLFTRFEELSKWDVRWDNTISANVNSWLNVNLGVIVIHEVSQTKRTQLREAFQIGIVYTIL
ncbi:MAG: DUF3078 domain-containing protein [Melioribacteraceae bacterium]|nr:DUF3078 domain-containing protein [Melioribacteraceae bacterium]